jgi:peptidoglycan/LPS O-acetylase OafA/YrhL
VVTTTRPRYPALDGIRAIAALAVVGTHAAFWTGHYRDTTAGLLLARLDFGVALFFVLSGFLLFQPWVRAGDTDTPSTRRFLWHRALRILPAYWVVVIAVYLLVPSGPGSGAPALLRNLTLTQVYGNGWLHADLTQMWSLATEVMFYLLLPVLAWAMLRLARGRPPWLLACCGVLAAVTVVWYAVTRSAVVLDASAVYWLPAYLDWFAAGMALSVLVVWWESGRDRAPAVLRAIAAAPGCCWVLAACLIAIAATPIAGGPTLGQSLTKNLLYLGAAVAIVAPCVLRTELTTTTRWIGGPVMRRVGLISYELFLVHLVVLDGVMRLMDYPVFTGSLLTVFVLTAALSLPLAWLLYRLVERPARRLRGRVGVPRSAPQPSRS